MIRSRPIAEHTIFAPRPNFPRVCFNPYFVPDKTAVEHFLRKRIMCSNTELQESKVSTWIYDNLRKIYPNN